MSASAKKIFGQLGLVVATSMVTVTLMGGGPVGAFSVPNNSVNSAKIVNNTVQGLDIRNGTVAGLDIRNGTVAGLDIRNGTVAGVDIKNGSLTNQDMAVGQRIVPINHRSGNTTDTEILSLNDLVLEVSCASGAETITASTTADDGELAVISNDASQTDASAALIDGTIEDSFYPSFDVPLDTSGGNVSDRQYTLTYSAADGHNVTAIFVTEDDIGSDNCIVSGHAFG